MNTPQETPSVISYVKLPLVHNITDARGRKKAHFVSREDYLKVSKELRAKEDRSRKVSWRAGKGLFTPKD